MKNILTLTVIAAFVVGVVWVIGYALDKQEKVDCLTWKQQASEYPGFYLTASQKVQCDSYYIIVSAPVK